MKGSLSCYKKTVDHKVKTNDGLGFWDVDDAYAKEVSKDIMKHNNAQTI